MSQKSTKPSARTDHKQAEFWRRAQAQAWAIFLVVIAGLIIIGGANRGGFLPEKLFGLIAWFIGWGAWFLIPGGLVYWAWYLFNKKSDQSLARAQIIAGAGFLVSFSGLLHVWADPELAGQLAREGANGGVIGYLASWIFMKLLNQPISFLIFLVATTTSGLLLFGVTPKDFYYWLKSRPLSRTKQSALIVNQTSPVVRSVKSLTQQTKTRLKPDKADPRPAPAVVETGPVKTRPAPVSRAKPKAGRKQPARSDWQPPSLKLLSQKQNQADAGNVQANAEIIKETLANFNIDVEMEGANIGPRVTQYTLRPPAGIRLAKITSLESNIALDLAASTIRIEAPIPGQRAVGIEVPNKKAATVLISDLLASKQWQSIRGPSLAFAIGKDIAGRAVIGRLEKMPHLMLAGQTGAGKSVAINALLTSLLYRCQPEQLRLILVDPKQVELAPYNDIPHLLTPVITEPEKCISALKWAVAEMERRLRQFAQAGKRNISEFNQIDPNRTMAFIVIVIDELADLMMMAARDVEALIVRIAQKARAAGIHIVLATQRPSVDVITGLIKANVPARIAFTVASQIDSRTIIDQAGAEKLLGLGDILYQTASLPKPIRVQGALVTDTETNQICQFLKQQRPAEYDPEVISQPVTISGGRGQSQVLAGTDDSQDVDDEMWQPALEVIINSKKASTSLLQRRLRIGYARAARLIELMEEKSIIGPADGARPRPVLVTSLQEAIDLDQTAEGSDDSRPETDDPAADLMDQTELEKLQDQDDFDLAGLTIEADDQNQPTELELPEVDPDQTAPGQDD